jgi:type VI secretion system protein ImpH
LPAASSLAEPKNKPPLDFGWRRPGSLTDWVFSETYRFEFTQAVRLLEAAAAQHSSESPTALGHGADPNREALRLRAAVHFKFPPRELAEAHRSTPDRPAELIANFFSLAGANAPLPDWVAELLLQQERHQDPGLRDFLDIFHHRLLALLYRVRLHYRPWLDPALLGSGSHNTGSQSSTRPDLSRARNAMAQRLLSFAGLGLPELQGRLGIPDEELLPFAGLLWHRPRSVHGLTRILEYALGVPVAARENRGVWRTLEPEDRTHLGSRRPIPGQPRSPDPGHNHVLGRTAILGRRVWDAQGRFDLILGPLTLVQFERLLPGQPDLHRLAAMVRFYSGDLMDVGIELHLQPEQAPAARLGAARLGWDAWVEPQKNPGRRTVRFLLPDQTPDQTRGGSPTAPLSRTATQNAVMYPPE